MTDLSETYMDKSADVHEPKGRLARRWASTRHFRPVLLLLVCGFILLSVTQQYFFAEENLENLVTGVGVLWIIAIGMTFVVLTGGVDLSASAIATLCGLLFAKTLNGHVPGIVAVLIAMAAGGLVGGLVNGMLISRLRLSFFVVTLASMTAFTGLANLWTNTNSVSITNPIAADIAINKSAGVPNLIWIMIALLLIALYVQSRTYFGRDVYSVGGNQTAARLAGIRVPRVLTSVYAISAACSGLAGIVAAGQVGSATPVVDGTIPLQAIAAVLLGGTSLFGGAGGVGGTALGVLFIGLVQNGLSIAGVQSSWQDIVTGCILVVAVLGSQLGYATGTRRRLAAIVVRLRAGEA